MPRDGNLTTRLVGASTNTNWANCTTDPAFVDEAQTIGGYVESVCVLNSVKVEPGIYSVGVGLTTNRGEIVPFVFPEAQLAVRVTADGALADVAETDRLDLIAAEIIPKAAVRLDRVYGGDLRLAGYRLDPVEPQPGDPLSLTLYWQPIRIPLEPLDLVVQLADSRSISLGRSDTILFEPALSTWLDGQVSTTRHEFELAPDLEVPLGGRLEVSLLNPAQVALPISTIGREPLDQVAGTFTIAPKSWPVPPIESAAQSPWKNGIILAGHALSSAQGQAGDTIDVRLFWETTGPIRENYVAFVHLLDANGQLVAQHDSLPRAGAYPTTWWQPGQVIEDRHPLVLPPELSPGTYQLVVGLYQQANGERLLLQNAQDSAVVGTLAVRNK